MPHHSGLRKMTLADTPVVAAIEQAVALGPWTEKLFAECISVGYDCWVLVEDKQIIGYGILSHAANEAHILNIGIIPEKQRQGYGKHMLQHLIEVAQMHGAEEIFLEVRESNLAAQELYHKFNFVEIGLRKAYYPENSDGSGREDAITLALPLW